jgi:sec-independent protein translocase protein TatB
MEAVSWGLRMPSLTDSAFIFVLALLLFGPKKLPELARQIGKLMAEFRRASNEFRSQMDEELRLSEQAERQKQIAAMEAAAPVAVPLDIPEPEHPHMQAETAAEPEPENHIHLAGHFEDAATPEAAPEPLPIASSGDLNLMPPSTGLPQARSGSSTSLAPVFDAIPESAPEPHTEASVHG